MSILFVFITCVIFCITTSVIKMKLDKTINVVLGVIFCASLIVSLFNPYDLDSVGNYAYLLLCIGYCAYFIGYASKSMIKTGHHYNGLTTSLTFLKRKRFKILFFICFAILFSLASTQWRLILFQQGLGSLKVDMFELIFENNSTLYFFYQAILFPLFHLSCILCGFLFLTKGSKKLVILFFLYALVFAFIGGKRGYFAILLEYFFIILLILKSLNGKGLLSVLKSSYKLLGVGLVAYILAAIMTSLASGGIFLETDDIKESGNENAKNLVVYTVGAYRAFDQGINGNYIDKADGYQLGRATLGGCLDYYMSGIMHRIGFPVESVRAHTMNQLQEDSIMIGRDTSFNFAYTGFMYFFFDFGVVGVIFFSFFYGRFVRFIVISFRSSKTIGMLAMLCFIFLSAFQITGSWFNIELSAQPTLLFFLFLSRMELKYRIVNN